MPKLLVVTHYFSSHGGGIETVAEILARQLVSEYGYEATWFSSDTDLPKPGPVGLHFKATRTWNFLERLRGVPYPVWGPGGLIQLWKAVGEADVVHIHDAIYMGTACAAVFARIRGKPLVVTQHIAAVPYSSAILGLAHHLANRWLGRWVISRATHIVFESEAVLEYFSSFCRFQTLPRCIPNGVDTTTFFPVDDRSRRTLKRSAGFPDSAMVFLFVGRFVEKKGLGTLQQLASIFPEDIFVLVGHGTIDPERWNCRNVVVLRGVYGKALTPYYQMADLFILPSVGEGFPLVIQEAMACGTPVLVGEETAAGSPAAKPFMFTAAVGGDDTVARWSERIKLLKSDQALQMQRPKIAERARQLWSWSAASESYSVIFRAAVRRESV